MQSWERQKIRDLAKEKLEISSLPEMQEKKRLWTLHNNCQTMMPVVHFEMDTVEDKGFRYQCVCESDEARRIELALGNSMANYKMVGDDTVVTPEFIVYPQSTFEAFSIPAKRVSTQGVGFHVEPVIEELSQVQSLLPAKIEFDMEGSLAWKDFVEEQIGDILTVRMGMPSLEVSLTQSVVLRMGMENMFMAMYDTPEEFHIMMDRLSDDYIFYFKELEKRGMIYANNGNDRLFQGSFGFTTDLPDKASKTTQCWGYMDSQETVGISPEMFDEFFFPYYKKVADQYGLLSYGCCEPVSGFWERSLSRFTNLRKISISPWCDEEYMGKQLSGKKIIYHRKPSPNFVGVGEALDEEGFRNHIRKTVRASKNCFLEISFRDVYNLNGNLDKPRRAVEITRQELENR